MLQVEKWLKRAFLPGMRTFRPSAVAIAITSPGESPCKMAMLSHSIARLATLPHESSLTGTAAERARASGHT